MSRRAPRPPAQTPRRVSFARAKKHAFDYSRDYRRLDLRAHPELYQVGVGEQGVLLVEPYKSELLPHWRFRTPEIARRSARALLACFERYARRGDFVGMDMARKFLQMGYTRSRRYANRRSGRKYDANGEPLPYSNDPVKASAAKVFYSAWKRVEKRPDYSRLKAEWKKHLG